MEIAATTATRMTAIPAKGYVLRMYISVQAFVLLEVAYPHARAHARECNF